jgi:hypothetical protein
MMVIRPSFRLCNCAAPLLPNKGVSDAEPLTGGPQHVLVRYNTGQGIISIKMKWGNISKSIDSTLASVHLAATILILRPKSVTAFAQRLTNAP